MRIIIDTKIDTNEDLQRAIRILQSLIDEKNLNQPQQENIFEGEQHSIGNILGDFFENKTENKSEPQKKEVDEKEKHKIEEYY
jgi:hypothetical protein